MAWSDLGSWESIYQKQTKDADNNVTHGEVFSQDTSNSLLWSQSSLLAILGLDNVVVIQTADATLVCDRSRTEEIKSLVARVKEQSVNNERFFKSVLQEYATLEAEIEILCAEEKHIVDSVVGRS